jgi:hypothetical protein
VHRRLLTNDFSKRGVHCLRVTEDLGDVRLQNDHIRSLRIATCVFSAYPLGEIVFVPNRFSAGFARCFSHRTCALGGWLLLIMWMLSPRSVCATMSNLPANAFPMVTLRFSASECSGSEMVNEEGSPKIVAASSKAMPCFTRFVRALCGSYSNVSGIIALLRYQLGQF